MAAFNWVMVRDQCPACHAEAEIHCQIHVASSFDGDEDGRFFDRTYRLGQRMAWYPGDGEAPESWCGFYAVAEDDTATSFTEEAISACTACKARLLVVIRFSDLTPTTVLKITVDSAQDH